MQHPPNRARFDHRDWVLHAAERSARATKILCCGTPRATRGARQSVTIRGFAVSNDIRIMRSDPEARQGRLRSFGSYV